MLNVACFVQSCLTDADFVIFSNYCLIGTRLSLSFLYFLLYTLLLPRRAFSNSTVACEVSDIST